MPRGDQRYRGSTILKSELKRSMHQLLHSGGDDSSRRNIDILGDRSFRDKLMDNSKAQKAHRQWLRRKSRGEFDI